VLIQATRRVAGSPRAPRFTCHKTGCGAIGMPRRASAGVPHRVKQSRVSYSATPTAVLTGVTRFDKKSTVAQQENGKSGNPQGC
jgi:hypothetical protein